MPNWYVSREAVKQAASVFGTERNARVDDIIEGESRRLDRVTRRFFIPQTLTRLFAWPQPHGIRADQLILDQDLISVTTLQTKAQDDSPTTISSDDFFVEPVNEGPPFSRIEIDQSSDASFESGDTPQRSISVAGSWGFSNDTKASGTVASGLASSASAVSMVCSDASLIDVGDTLLIESEQVFVSERVAAAEPNNDLIDGALTATQSQVGVTVDDGTRYSAREIILVDSEQMFIDSISSNTLTVRRAFNGSVLAAHSNDAPVSVFRTLTVERGVNGTTAATHANSTAVTKYMPERDVATLVRAEVVAIVANVGAGEGAIEFKGTSLEKLRKETYRRYTRNFVRTAVV